MEDLERGDCGEAADGAEGNASITPMFSIYFSTGNNNRDCGHYSKELADRACEKRQLRGISWTILLPAATR